MSENREQLNTIPVVPILGVNIAAINMEWLLEFTQNNIHSLSGQYMCVANVHTTVMAFENKKYKDVQNGSALAIPDGGPLSSIGRKRGYPEMARTTGPSYMEEILNISVDNGYKHFFYGSTQETLDQLELVLNERYPKIQIVGMYSPPFRPLSEKEDLDIIELINNSKSDFIWVGLGAPKQEIWMSEHKDKIQGFMVGVGAGFDYLAGNIERAPEWMQKHNLEWFYRLKQEPKRLLKRYLRTNSKFIWHAYIRGK